MGYRIPRLDGRRLGLSADLSLTWNRNGEVEGSGGSLGGRHGALHRAHRMGVVDRDELVRRGCSPLQKRPGRGGPERRALGVPIPRRVA